ncbi:MAG: 2,5-dichloro-2,5-cyclohexadiene-1,4-diol dehydrogenase [Syntrophorhabdus sp. PtaU1.Bin050]|nr:MAG: 2,5-dichloro-2,5-cyclohexadiene-1,4-diol dehydrogenase [Syntrophorhabdus sp. PtaU1.Bin050]
MRSLLKNKVVLVTGGTSGIGRASALLFAREGARVVIADVVAEEAQNTTQMIREEGGDAIFVKTDVSKAAEVEALVRKTVETYGRLDCAFNNAGIGHVGTIIDCTEEEWDRVMAINLKGVWLCMKYEIIHMAEHGGGAIVNTSSTAGIVAHPRRAIYTVSKHGVIGLTKAAALQYAKAGIRVNAVCPGPIRTALTESSWISDPQAEARAISEVPMDRAGTPEEVAEAAVWLCSDAASYVTGLAMVVDGGSLVK